MRLRNGFSLLELIFVLLIAGFLVGLGTSVIPPMLEAAKFIENKEKMARIEQALSAYAVLNNRIPCPENPNEVNRSEPDGYESGSGAVGSFIPHDGCAAILEGTVPYATLGVEKAYTIDPWGKSYSYAVSPVFTLNPRQSQELGVDVHTRCRSADWFFRDSGDINNEFVNRNPLKSYFCCPGEDVFAPSTDLVLRDVNGDNIIHTSRNSSEYRSVNTPVGNFYEINAVEEPVQAISFILVGHGPNGYGAFMPDGSRGSFVEVRALEQENANSDRIFSVSYERLNEFDDFILWRTQDSLIGMQGGSCAVP